MESKALSNWLKAVVVGIVVCGLLSDFVIVPLFGRSIVEVDPARWDYFWPWLIFAWAFSVPLYAALVFAWRIAGNIGRERSFSAENARFMKIAAILLGADTIFFFGVNVVFMIIGINVALMVILCPVFVLIGAAATIAVAVLSRLISKAAELQDQIDLTI